MGDGRRAKQVSDRSLERQRQTGASRRTVLIALTANGAVAVAKLVAGLLSSSSAMLAEAAHSVADTTNQAFLLVSIKLGERKPEPRAPFGFGQERFVWTFMAAIGMFLAGATFAIGFGIYELLSHQGENSQFGIAYVVLALSFAAEGTSWVRALRQTRREAREHDMPLRRYMRQSRDPNVKMVLFEDSAALVGVVVAAAGIGLNQATGATVFDPLASIVIGLLLVGVASWMARDSKHLLVGASARPDERDALEKAIGEFDEIDEVVELLTLVLGPNALLVAARVDLADGLSGERIEEVSTRIDERLREVVPDVTEVFLDATAARD